MYCHSFRRRTAVVRTHTRRHRRVPSLRCSTKGLSHVKCDVTWNGLLRRAATSQDACNQHLTDNTRGQSVALQGNMTIRRCIIA